MKNGADLLRVIQSEESFPKSGNVGVDIENMYFPYFIPHCFSSHSENEHREAYACSLVSRFVLDYATKWLSDNQPKNASDEEVRRELYYLAEKIFSEVPREKFAKENKELAVPINFSRSKLLFRRFGNSIGVNVENLDSGNKSSNKTAEQTLENMLSSRLIYLISFVDRIHFNLSFPKDAVLKSRNSAITVNLVELMNKIFKVVPGELKDAEPDFWHQFVASYLDTNEKSPIVANIMGINLSLSLEHYDHKKKDHRNSLELKNSREWRRGNFTKTDDKEWSYRFEDKNDLFVRLTVHSGLDCNFLKDLSHDVETDAKQYKMKQVAAMVYAGLLGLYTYESISKSS